MVGETTECAVESSGIPDDVSPCPDGFTLPVVHRGRVKQVLLEIGYPVDDRAGLVVLDVTCWTSSAQTSDAAFLFARPWRPCLRGVASETYASAFMACVGWLALLLAAVHAVALNAGCSSKSSSQGENCTAGEAVQCKTVSGCTGFKVCRPSGNGYDACECSDGGVGGSATGGSSGSSGGSAGGIGGTGGSACAATEDCWNSIDDDCNNLIDCADPACGGPAVCVPDAPGAALGTFVAADESCPTGFTPVTLNRDISAPYECAGCSCVPNETRCESGVYGHGTYPCPSYQYSGLLYNVFSNRCDPLPSDTRVHYFDVRGFTTCTPQGTGTPAPPSWAETRTFCQAERVGGGCAAGWVCVHAVSTPACSLVEGTASCDAAYPNDSGVTWYAGYTDARSCPACSCSFGTANCAGAYIQAYSAANCSGSTVQLGSGAEGDSCSLPFTPVSGRVIGTPTSPSCEPNSGPNGELTPTDPHTVCCR